MFLEKVYNGRNQWYYYVFTLLVTFMAWQFIGVIPLGIYTFVKYPALLQDPSLLPQFLNQAMRTNTGLALMLLAFAFGLVALLLCVKYIQKKKYTDIITGRRQIDWERILFGAGIWALLAFLSFGIQAAYADPSELVFQFELLPFLKLVIISFTLLPLQTSFEELLFRGYLMQWSAYLFRYRWISILLTGILFGAMHAANPETNMGFWIVMPQYILMGILLSYVTVKDDGMELALGLHMANNITAALTVTSSSYTLQTHALFRITNPSASHWETLGILVTSFLFLWICNQKYHFMGKIDIMQPIAKENV